MNINLPFTLANNGVIDVVTISANSMYTVLKLALEGNPRPAIKSDMLAMISAIEKAWEAAERDDEDEWEH